MEGSGNQRKESGPAENIHLLNYKKLLPDLIDNLSELHPSKNQTTEEVFLHKFKMYQATLLSSCNRLKHQTQKEKNQKIMRELFSDQLSPDMPANFFEHEPPHPTKPIS